MTESVAITGCSGRYPNCVNIEELQKSLFAGVDLVSNSHRRWSAEFLGTTPRLGVVTDFEYFDAAFFGMTSKDAEASDPRTRKLLEVTYEAIVDAGLNPTEIRGSRTGVFLGISQNHFSECGYKGGFVHRSAAIIANTISYFYDFKGPSFALDTACSSGLYALSCAVDSILSDRCSMAVVCVAHSQFDPAESMELLKYRVLHVEGTCRSFDLNRKGYVKSEAIVAIILQKVEESKRIYATIAGVGTNIDGFKREGIHHPSHEAQKLLLQDTCQKFNIDPKEVSYVETHGTGTVVGDLEEVRAIDEFFCGDRETPLLIGAVKSNVGHSETASALVSLTKVIISICKGVIPGNLHYNTPDPQLRGIEEGRLKVVDKRTPLPDGLIAINAFGFGGANGTVIIRPHKARKQVANNLSHRLVHVSGRTEEGVRLLLETAIKNKSNEQFLALFDNIFCRPIDNHSHRGYAILSQDSHFQIQTSSKTPPVWFVYSGVGSQWSGMAKDLMKIEIFRNTMRKCANAVKIYGINLEDIVMNGTEDTFDDITNTYISIVAVSVCLTDVLTSMNVKPDGIIGHSLGEVVCAYADGLITAEQATLLAYSRGNAISASNLEPGLMATVGLSITDCSKILPENVYIACDNTDQNVTISGPEQPVQEFLRELSAKGIFNRVVNSAKCALHSPLLVPAGPKMYDFVKNILPAKKLRSRRWLVSAIPEKEWDSDLGKYNSAEYYLHNFLNRVEFRQLLKHVPEDALVIEVAPRGILQPILKRALSKDVTLISLLRPYEDNVEFLLSNVGKVFINGGPLDLRQFYNKIKFPVSIDTPMISSLIKWDHKRKWSVPRYNSSSCFGERIEIDLSNHNNHYFEQHVIDGKIVVPAAAYIVFVWQAFSKMLSVPATKLPVVFEDLEIMRPIFLSKKTPVTLVINILKSTGHFEIIQENDAILLTKGQIKMVEDDERSTYSSMNLKERKPHQLKMNSDDFYKFMRLRGYSYSGVFLGVQKCDVEGTRAILKWYGNWISFIDAMIHFACGMDSSGLSLPSEFQKITIDPETHLKSELILNYNKSLKTITCGGIELNKIKFVMAKRHYREIPSIVGKYTFVPNTDSENGTDPFFYSINIAAQIVVENCTTDLDMKIAEIGSKMGIQMLKMAMERVSLKHTTFYQIASFDQEIENKYFDLLITHDDKFIYKYIKKARFIFGKLDIVDLDPPGVEIIYQHVTKSGIFVLLRTSEFFPEKYDVISTHNNSFGWIEDLKKSIKQFNCPKSRIYLVNEDLDSGIVGFFNSVRHERHCPNLRIFLIRSSRSVPFAVDSSFYEKQIKKDLTVNVYQDGCWGSYRLLLSRPLAPILVTDACLLRDNTGVKWVTNPCFDSDKISVKFASVNEWDTAYFDDTDLYLGLEYSGIDEKGNNVMGLVSGGAISTKVKAHPQLTWTFNSELSFEDAATVPLAYTMSYYGLFVRAHLSSTDSLLVHNCLNVYSQTAVTWALRKGCKVYIVADTHTVHFLHKNNPNMSKAYIVKNSESNPFYETVLAKTNGKGVNVVFNCGTPKLLKLSLNCMSRNGHFVEIGNNGSKVNGFSSSKAFMVNQCSYCNVTPNDIFGENLDVLNKISTDIKTYLREESVIPFKFSIFDQSSFESALKHIDSSNYGKKCLLKINNTENPYGKSNTKILAHPRTYMNPAKSYIIIGGLGGFGLELANWLIERGATKLVLNSSRGVISGYQSLCLHKWNRPGIVVLTNTYDTTTQEGAEALLNFATNIGPIGGIFNSALYLVDKVITEQSEHTFKAVVAPKVFSTQNMDLLSRKMCRDLDYFVVFSSIISSLGNAAQSSYSFANSAMERLCESRRAEGLHGLAVEWGPVGDVGFVARLKTKVKILEAVPQGIVSCLKVLDRFMQQDDAVVWSLVYDGGESSQVEKTETSIVKAVAAIFGIQDQNSVDDAKTLADLGMDSLLGFEIRHLLAEEYGTEVATNEIRNLTWGDIKYMSSNI